MKTLGFISTTQAYQLQFGRLSSGTVRAKKTAQDMTPVVTYEEAFKALSLRPYTILQEAERIFEEFRPWLEKAGKGTPTQLYKLKDEHGNSINSTVLAQSQYVTQEELYLLELALLQKIQDSGNAKLEYETVDLGGTTITIGKWTEPTQELINFLKTKEAEKYCWTHIDNDGDHSDPGISPERVLQISDVYGTKFIRCEGLWLYPGEYISEDED